MCTGIGTEHSSSFQRHIFTYKGGRRLEENIEMGNVFIHKGKMKGFLCLGFLEIYSQTGTFIKIYLMNQLGIFFSSYL